jgi:ATP-dependent NAD(P)H-hydrate dehydratase
MQAFGRIAISLARSKGMFVVADADALWIIGQDLSLVQGYRRTVLTPNVAEFKRLLDQADVDPHAPAGEKAALLSRKLGGVTVLQKGPQDIVAVDTTGDEADLAESVLGHPEGDSERVKETVEVDVEGGLKRCGGQGDVLSGAVGAVLSWGKCYEDGAFG